MLCVRCVPLDEQLSLSVGGDVTEFAVVDREVGGLGHDEHAVDAEVLPRHLVARLRYDVLVLLLVTDRHQTRTQKCTKWPTVCRVCLRTICMPLLDDLNSVTGDDHTGKLSPSVAINNALDT